MPEAIAFKAHARLLTMLGEQLIKNERIALVELVKNSYDADATVVTVDFQNFGDDFVVIPDSAIVITDNGSGMSSTIVRTTWMNPATPSKAIAKAKKPTTALGRVLQGEKGIGRFAAFRLGRQVSLITRASGSPEETTLLVDIGGLDEGSDGSQQIDYYLDDLPALFDVGAPATFDGKGTTSTQGTQLEIRGLRAEWSEALVLDAYSDLDRLQPQLWARESDMKRADFEVLFLRDGTDLNLGAERSEEFQAVLERAVLRVTSGAFSAAEQRLEFDVNARHYDLDLGGSEIRGVKPFRDYFRGKDGDWATPQCGSFGFEFYIFDITGTAPVQHLLDSEEKSLVKDHRIYLYRDGIRVYPYGDPQDDWLEIDAIRGTQAARSMFSNNQTVGFITITQAGNPQLRDKTSREGLLEAGRATRDFVVLIQSVLAYLRSKPYEQYNASKSRAREKVLKSHRIDSHIELLRKMDLPNKAREHLDALESALGAEREVSEMRVGRTEQLAGVGLSVETASHDLIVASGEALRVARHIVDELRLLDLQGATIYVVAQSLVTRLEFIGSRFRDVQGLFVSTRQKRAILDIVQLTRRVRLMYGALHEHEGIDFIIDDDSRLKAMSTEAAVLQCLINLVDNATYWLTTSSHKTRTIRAFTPDDHTLVVTDDGPGVKPLDQEYIFDPFYSGKGDAGKGLGLYIARQNGLRSGFSVELSETRDPRNLPGATFVVDFEEVEGA